MKRGIARILLATSLSISLLSLIAWPLSYFVTLRIAYVGRSFTQHGWIAVGQFSLLRQSGGGMPEFFERNNITSPDWSIDVAPYHPRYYDSVDRWNSFRASLRPQTRTTTMPSPTGGVINQRMISVPFWPIAWLFAMPPAIAWQRHRLRRRRQRQGLCLRCGYDLRASPDKCPECGFERPRIMSPKTAHSTPSPGTPGEGWGEGSRG